MPEGEDPEQPRRVAAPVRTVRAGIVVAQPEGEQVLEILVHHPRPF